MTKKKQLRSLQFYFTETKDSKVYDVLVLTGEKRYVGTMKEVPYSDQKQRTKRREC
jgi:hypothetical protein